MRSTVRISALALLAGSAMACGGAPPKHAETPHHVIHPKKAEAPAAPAYDGPPLLPASVIGAIDDPESTPLYARRGDDGLVFYTVSGRMKTRLVGPDGKPRAEAVDVGPLLAEPTTSTLRATRDGWIVAWVELAGKNHAVQMLALDAKGHAVGTPAFVTQSAEEIGYVDVLPNDKGALLLWEMPHDQRSDLFVVPVASGRIAGSPSAVVRDVIGWDACPTARGAALAVVTAAGPAAAPDAPRLGRVSLFEVDPSGKAGPATIVSTEPTAEIDPQIGEVGGRYVVAWTDERDIDASVYLASVAPGGNVVAAPRRATAPSGEQALVALVPADKGGRALLAWEDLLRSRPNARRIHLGTIGSDGAIAPERATLVMSANGPPDIAADGDGFAAVTLARAMADDAAATDDAPVEPTFVRFGPDLAVRASEPIRAEPFADTPDRPYVPYLTRDLACGGGTCTALATGAGDAPSLALVSLPVRKNGWRTAALRDADEGPPRATRVESIQDGDRLADVAAARTANGMLAGWVTYVLDDDGARPAAEKAKRSRDDEPAATLALRPISAAGAPGKPVVISKHALSVGGIALATATTGKPETTVAWVARENGEPQVFVTKVGPDGAKLAQKGVTVIHRKTKGALASEASDVAIAYAGENGGEDAWIVAWVDTRDGNAEIYVAKVDRNLKKIVPDRRITTAAGDAAEVSIVVRGKETFLAWSDARQNPDAGTTDVYLARLETRSLKKLGEETRLFASSGHSRSPALAPTPKGLALAWIEESAAAAVGKRGGDDAASAEAGVRLAWLDPEGRMQGAPLLLAPENKGPVTSLAMACDRACRGVLTSSAGEGLAMSAFTIEPGGTTFTQKAIGGLTGAASEDVAPAFASAKAEALFFADEALGGTSRVRWMSLSW